MKGNKEERKHRELSAKVPQPGKWQGCGLNLGGLTLDAGLLPSGPYEMSLRTKRVLEKSHVEASIPLQVFIS